ncbi:1,2-phenylacetyl-CoA epoxidase subunit PaaD [Haloferax gibbonsii]|uniref:1,2-phenylacetyl-CoA epoxidase subunit PaaD n=1 Tax=Haloferax gibbonsii TaxID=35746 RepID=UPI0009E2A84D|nr:1,2-phenylacetyl-CoA epoxidase subunit PaaD [Haloferax gibbonsii]
MSDVSADDAPEATACGYTEYADGEVPEGFPKTGVGAAGIEADIWDALYEIEDPEMPVSIVDLGLIYDVRVVEREGEDGEAKTLGIVEMTLTYTGCPARDYLENDVQCAILSAGVDEASVRLRFTPEWTVDMVTEAGREALREFGLGV